LHKIQPDLTGSGVSTGVCADGSEGCGAGRGGVSGGGTGGDPGGDPDGRAVDGVGGVPLAVEGAQKEEKLRTVWAESVNIFGALGWRE
jgi:hypothetical protein